MSEQQPIDFSMLLASSVHDVKNSLAMLIQSLEELVEEDTSNERKSKYSILRGEASRINHTLIHLLGMYRLQTERLTVNLQEVYVADFLEEQIANHQLLFDVNNISVTVDCDEDLTAFFDENLVAGIISNVLVNDAKYTKDSIRIEAQATKSGGICIAVIDNGDGFPQNIIESVQIESEQPDSPDHSDRSIDFASGSTNLGLYFAQQIAALHQNKDTQGTIQLSNIESGGGKFTLTLP